MRRLAVFCLALAALQSSCSCEKVVEKVVEVPVETPDTHAPSFAGVLTASAVDARSIALTWLPAVDDRSAADKIAYHVFSATAAGGENFAAGVAAGQGAVSFTVNGLEPDTRYFFAVRAEDEAGNRDANLAEASAVTMPEGLVDSSEDGTLAVRGTVKRARTLDVNPSLAAANTSLLLLAEGTRGFEIVDVTGLPATAIRASVDARDSVEDLAADPWRGRLYVADGTALSAYDITGSRLYDPVYLGTEPSQSSTAASVMALWSDRAYVAHGDEIVVYDTGLWGKPTRLRSFQAGDVVKQLVAAEMRLYVVTASTVETWELADRTTPLRVGTFAGRADALGAFYVGYRLLTVGYADSVVTYDLFAPHAPVTVADFAQNLSLTSVALDNGVLALTNARGRFLAYGLPDPATPLLLAHVVAPASMPDPTWSFAARGYAGFGQTHLASIRNLPPFVRASLPAAGAVDVDGSSGVVRLDFSKPVTGVNDQTFTVTPENGSALPGYVRLKGPTTATFRASAGEFALSLTHTVQLDAAKIADQGTPARALVSASATRTFKTSLARPRQLAGASENEQIRLSWTAPAGGKAPTGYRVYWKTDWIWDLADATAIDLDTATAHYDHSGLTNGTLYCYRVAAVYPEGASGPSNQVCLRPGVPPTGLGAVADLSRVTLSWSPPAGLTVQSYNVYWLNSTYVTRQNGIKIEGVESPYVHAGLLNGSTYCYVVTAVTAGGESPESGVACATPGIPVPRYPAVAAENGALSVSWMAPEGLRAPDSYNLYWANTPAVSKSFGTQIAGQSSPTLHKNLTNGTQYCYVVTAVYPEGESADSPVACGRPGYPPRALSAIPDNQRVDLSWLAPLDGAPASYNVYWSHSETFDKTAAQLVTGVSAESYAHTGLVNGVQYCYLVTAQTSVGESSESNVVCAVPGLSNPRNLAATPGAASVTLDWQAPAVGTPTSYALYWSTSPGVDPRHGDRIANVQSGYTHDGLVNGQAYYYVVTAEENGLQSTASNEAMAVPSLGPVPATPTGLAASAANQQVFLWWSPVATAQAYVVYWSESAGVSPATAQRVSGVGAHYFTHTGLTNGRTYYYAVAAVNGNGESGLSSEIFAIPNPGDPPDAPYGVSVQGANQSLAVSWYTPNGNPSAYNLYWSTTPGVTPQTGTRVAGIQANGTTLRGLTNGTQYYLVVTAENPNGESAPSTEVSGIPSAGAAPSAPGSLYATGGNQSAQLWWAPVAAANFYNLYWSTSAGVVPGAAGVAKVSGLGREYTTLANLANGTKYYFAVTAENANGESAPSPEASAQPSPGTAPGTPVGAYATPGNTSVSLTWFAPTGDANFYNVYWSASANITVANSQKVAALTTTSHTVTNLVNGTTYYFLVTAENANGESAPTSPLSAVPAPGLPPTAPQGVRSNPGNTSAEIAWNAVAEASFYNLYWGEQTPVTRANAAKVPGITALGRTVAGLTNGTTYYFVVTAENGNGESPFSSEVSSIPTIGPSPDAPTGLQGVAGNQQATLTWATAGGSPDYYRVYRSTATPVTAEAANLVASPATTGFNDSGLVNGTTYHYAVTAVNANGESALSNEVAVQPTTGPKPAAPTGLDGVPGNSSLVLSWNAVAGADFYNVYYSTSTPIDYANSTKIPAVSATTRTVGNLNNGTKYYFVVTAENANGESPFSLEISAVPATGPVPGVPGNLTAQAGNTQVTLYWATAQGSPDFYNVYWSTTSPVDVASAPRITGIVATTFTHTGRVNGTTYHYVVTAENANGESAPSNEIAAQPTLGPAPDAPGGTYVLPGNTSNLVGWSAVSGASFYNVYWSTSSAVSPATGTKIPGIAGTSTTHAGLVNGTTYYYVVTAENSNGESAPSSVINGTPNSGPPPAAPYYLSVLPGNARNTLTWAVPGGNPTSYAVYWSTSAGVTPATGTKIGGIATNTFVHTGLTNGATYYYVVTALNQNGESEPSAQGSGAPTASLTSPSKAEKGIPADANKPSANVGQTILLTGSDLRADLDAVFTANAYSDVRAALSSVAADGTSAFVTVPEKMGNGDSPRSGTVRVVDHNTGVEIGRFDLQIVPLFDSISHLSPNVAAQVVVKGYDAYYGCTVKFTLTDQTTPSASISGWTSTAFTGNVTVPASGTAIPKFQTRVVCAGHQSEERTEPVLQLQGVSGLPTTGTGADAAYAAVNVGDTLTLYGVELADDLYVRFYRSASYWATEDVQVSELAADKSWATLAVPVPDAVVADHPRSTAISIYKGNPASGGVQVGAYGLVQIVPQLLSISHVSPGAVAQVRARGLDGYYGATANFLATNNSTVLQAGLSGCGLDGASGVWTCNVTVPANAKNYEVWLTQSNGGTSAHLSGSGTLFKFGTLTGTAASGTPADAAVASANLGTTLTLTGENLGNDLYLRFTRSSSYWASMDVKVSDASADGKTATAVVPLPGAVIPDYPRSGAVYVYKGDPAAGGLQVAAVTVQIVPQIVSISHVSPGATAQVAGRGLDLYYGATVNFRATDDVTVLTAAASGCGLDAAANLVTCNVTVPANAKNYEVWLSQSYGGTSTHLSGGGLFKFTGLTGVASRGTPADPGQASAALGDTLTLHGENLTDDLYVRYTRSSSYWASMDVKVSAASTDKTTATVEVPGPDEVLADYPRSGTVYVYKGNPASGGLQIGAVTVQIVPEIFSISHVSGGATAQVTGRGWDLYYGPVVNFLAVDDTTVLTAAATGCSVNGAADLVTCNVTVPANAKNYEVWVTQSYGGTSTHLIGGGLFRYTGLTGTASSGTPADAAQPSANAGDTLTLHGENLTDDLYVRFTRSASYWASVDVPASAASADKKTATVVVPVPSAVVTDYPRSGTVYVYRGNPASGGLQIGTATLQMVPQLDSIDHLSPGSAATLTGRSFDLYYTPTVNFLATDGYTVLTAGVSGCAISPSTFLTTCSVSVPANARNADVWLTQSYGGTSTHFTTAVPQVARVVAVAAQGTPATASALSANLGQTITVQGALLDQVAEAKFNYTNKSFGSGNLRVALTNVRSGGTLADVVVPTANAQNDFPTYLNTLEFFTAAGKSVGAFSSFQIVPELTAVSGYAAGPQTLTGTGFFQYNGYFWVNFCQADSTCVNLGYPSFSADGQTLTVTVPSGYAFTYATVTTYNAGTSNRK